MYTISYTHSSIKREDKFNERPRSLKAERVIPASHRSRVFCYTPQHHIVGYVRK